MDGRGWYAHKIGVFAGYSGAETPFMLGLGDL